MSPQVNVFTGEPFLTLGLIAVAVIVIAPAALFIGLVSLRDPLGRMF